MATSKKPVKKAKSSVKLTELQPKKKGAKGGLLAVSTKPTAVMESTLISAMESCRINPG